ncbi:MAG TPA: SpoIIE family protein phosphatase [Marmoricola sp.]|nr:SpoIIE family protein phosphatase [Marmoricola sp.]
MTTGDGEFIEGFFEALLDDDAQTLYDRAPCGYLSTTPDGTIIKANATFLTLTGYTRDQLVGRKRFVDLLAPGGRIYHETHYAPMLRMHGVAHEIALELVSADARRVAVLLNAVLERDESGDPVVIRTAVFDASHRRRYEQELLREKQRAEASEAHASALARTLQQTLIPPVLPTIPGLAVAAEYRPAGDGSVVGGDFYDIFQAGEDDWVAVIGDVCGKGAEAAVVTALARYTLRAAAVQDPSPARALELLNAALRRAETTRFCTVAMLRLTRIRGTWQVTTSVGGHPRPLRLDSRGDLTPLGHAGPLLGVLPAVDLPQDTTTAREGDTLVMYTDGVTEARNADDEFYGEERLRAALAATVRDETGDPAASLLADVLGFQDNVARDDIAIVALKF